MKRVTIIKGAYGYQPEAGGSVRAVTRKDGPIELSDEEAARLVSLRVAEYIPDPEPETPVSSVATGPEGENGGGEGDTPPGGDDADSGDNDPGEDDVLEIVDGHFTAESLKLLTNDNLRKLAADLGADVSKCKNKAGLVAVLITVEVEDDGPPPAPGVEAPVV